MMTETTISPVFWAGALLMGAGALFLLCAARALRTAGDDRLRRRLALLMPDMEEGAVELALENRRVAEGRGIRATVGLWFAGFLVRAGGWAGLRLSAPLAMGAGLGTAVIADRVFQSGLVIAVLSGILVAVLMFRRAFDRRESKWKAAFLEHLPHAIELIVRAAQAGIPVSEAIAAVGDEIEDPVGGEFRAIAHKTRLGVDVKAALTEVAERVNLVDFDCFVVSLIVQRETGGQLSETLQGLATIIRRRKETRAKAKALTAEGRMTANVIGALPFVISGMLGVANPKYMSVMLVDPTGRMMLLIAGGCMVAGMLAISRITKTEL